ncbi:MAG: hypothetical protein H8D97_00235 [Proteobacteria bacterium]|nr:hypothetical protein [Pseudomonadota bacterium]
MSRRLTHGEFLEKTNVKHGNKFIYLTKYSKSHDKIHIKCLDCGDEFWQLAYSHLDGRGCLNCANIKRTKSHKDFVKEAYVKHNNQFEYLSKYINNQTKIDIKCLKCNNVFSQEPRSHLRFGSQCPHSEKIKDHNAFLLKANIVHPNKFRYLSLFIKDAIKIKIECLDCDNVFEQRPSSHLSGVGCSDCSKKEADIKKRKSHKDFVADANLIHFNKFEYLTEYLNSKEKIQIKCLDCENIFYQKPSSHLEGRGCKECADFHSGGYCEDYFNDRPEMRDTPAILYFL